jgi:transcriptional regulator with XRE-family HTH domain
VTTISRPLAGPVELRRFRKRYHLRQEDLAKLLGVSRLAVARWEAGMRTAQPYLGLALQALAVALERTRKPGFLRARPFSTGPSSGNDESILEDEAAD